MIQRGHCAPSCPNTRTASHPCAVDGLLLGTHCLIHDRNPLFTGAVRDTLADGGVEAVRLPPRSPSDLSARSRHPAWSGCSSSGKVRYAARFGSSWTTTITNRIIKAGPSADCAASRHRTTVGADQASTPAGWDVDVHLPAGRLTAGGESHLMPPVSASGSTCSLRSRRCAVCSASARATGASLQVRCVRACAPLDTPDSESTEGPVRTVTPRSSSWTLRG